MTKPTLDSTIAKWTRLGIAFGGRQARKTPDIEHLLLDTARLCHLNARLFYLAVTWLSQYSNYVARHRLKRLIEAELDLTDQPALGALLVLAIKCGASRELGIAADICAKAAKAGPLFDIQRGKPSLERIAQQQTSKEAKRWNLWIPDQPAKLDALRPTAWLLKRNPNLIERSIRKGDLRCSILETLRCDLPNQQACSEVDLAKACSANRIAIRNALDDLEREGYPLRKRTPNSRSTTIVLVELTVPLIAA